MGKITYTEASQPWSKRVGGGYPNLEDLELAADFLDFDVLVGPKHPTRGFFMIRDERAGLKPTHKEGTNGRHQSSATRTIR